MANRVWIKSEGAILDLDFVPLIYKYNDRIEIFLSLNHDAAGKIPRLVIEDKLDRERVWRAYCEGSENADTRVAVQRATTIRPVKPEPAAPTPIRPT